MTVEGRVLALTGDGTGAPVVRTAKGTLTPLDAGGPAVVAQVAPPGRG